MATNKPYAIIIPLKNTMNNEPRAPHPTPAASSVNNSDVIPSQTLGLGDQFNSADANSLVSVRSSTVTLTSAISANKDSFGTIYRSKYAGVKFTVFHQMCTCMYILIFHDRVKV